MRSEAAIRGSGTVRHTGSKQARSSTAHTLQKPLDTVLTGALSERQNPVRAANALKLVMPACWRHAGSLGNKHDAACCVT